MPVGLSNLSYLVIVTSLPDFAYVLGLGVSAVLFIDYTVVGFMDAKSAPRIYEKRFRVSSVVFTCLDPDLCVTGESERGS